jgi:ATP synthase protein I
LGRELEAVEAAKPKENEKNPAPRSDAAGIARGLRLSSEMVAGVIVGGLIGWLIDRLTGYSPWGLIVFVLLGFVAGVLNVLRSAGLAPPPGGRTEG